MLLIGVCRQRCYEEPDVITALPPGERPRSRRGRSHYSPAKYFDRLPAGAK